MTKATTNINGKSVGSGYWSLNSAKRYCEKKGISLDSMQHVQFSVNYGFDYTDIDVTTGEELSSYNSDPLRRMLGV